MNAIQKVQAYHVAVPFIVNRDDYDDAFYQYESDYYNAMIKALKFTDDDITELETVYKNIPVPSPLLVDYTITVTYEYDDWVDNHPKK